MTQESYLKHLGEKINDNGGSEIGILPTLRLVLTYNKRYLAQEKVSEFDKNVSEKLLDMHMRASKAIHTKDDKALKAVKAEALALCEQDIQKAFSFGKNAEQGLYNVHTFVAECEAVDKKESIKEARKIADFSLATSDARRDYLDARANAEYSDSALYDEVVFKSLYSRVTGMSESDFRVRLEQMSRLENQALLEKEGKYFPRVVEEMVREDVRISCSANNTSNDMRAKQ